MELVVASSSLDWHLTTVANTFNVGDTVRSKVTAQGLTTGALYRVEAVRTARRNFLGGYTTYDLRLVGGTEQALGVVNGHLLLEKV